MQDDAHLVSASQDGHLSAFNLIVERYQFQVYNVAARILGDRTTSEDVAQETFISAHRALARFRGGSLRAWLLRIATNLSYDYMRSSRRRREQSLEEAVSDRGFAVPSGEPSPEQAAVQSELRDEIQQAIMSLPRDQGTVLVLIDVQGLSYDEAAESLGVSIGTVKSRLSRARSKTRDYLMQRRELIPDQFRQIR